MIELALAFLDADIAADCTLNGVPLHGRVEVVEHFADFDVEIVDGFPDLDVKPVTSFPDECGEWEFVDTFPDFTVRFVDSFPDFTIQYVERFPGLH
ncbi:MAG: hypothetical protein ACFE0P_14645 [Oceanicaulis sp.]